MRKSYIFTAMLFWSLTSFAQFSGTGAGTSSSPYLITNASQLNEVRNFLSTEGVYFRLENDIDLTSFILENYPTNGWMPIGTTSAPFMGYFDGNKKTIKGLVINRPTTSYVGLFGDVKNGTILRMVVDNCNVQGQNDVGGLCGEIEGTSYVSECGVSGTITGSFNSGGLIGLMSGGRTAYSQIDNCYFNGDVTGNGGTYCCAGGLVGYNSFCGINKCYAAGTVHSSYHVGGILGSFNNAGSPHPGYVMNCMAANTKLWGSYWTGRIIGEYTNYSYVSGGNKAYSGMEIYFMNNTSPRDNVYDGCNSSNGTDNGTGVSQAATLQANTYTSMGWDFTNIWAIDEGTTLPYFKWSKALEYYDLTISSYGLSTLYLDYTVKIPYEEYDPDILGVYYAYDISNGEVRLARLNEFIPAGTAVIVQGNSGTYRFVETKTTPTPLKYENLLKGSTENITASQAKAGASDDAVIMMLGKGSNGYVGFYKYTRNTIPAHRAYIVYEGAENANSLSLGFTQDATGITNVQEERNHDEWYTLQGVKLGKSTPVQKGIYIYNGKKTLVK